MDHIVHVWDGFARLMGTFVIRGADDTDAAVAAARQFYRLSPASEVAGGSFRAWLASGYKWDATPVVWETDATVQRIFN